ncbi:unnamed protein product [Gongylonema pulchrum]|uniref:AGC-kinase C-terminal domain-containing protein n=1 Tax=Gongylonema pulchrum TaxID=637853 RepID=A0A183D400_9BILA|nr:unnamed protein product [Gongylonema pulchrum]
MRRFWNWIIDQKTNTVKKWQSAVLNMDRCQQHSPCGHLKPIGGSDDELNREQRKTSKGLMEAGNSHRSSISLQNFENFEEDYKATNFEEFFDESSGAIKSALVSFLD